MLPPLDNHFIDLCSIVAGLRDQIYRILLCFFFVVQSLILFAVPVAGPVLSVLAMSWLYAFYCFEHVWALHDWPLLRQIAFFELRWAYFLGFGQSPLPLRAILVADDDFPDVSSV